MRIAISTATGHIGRCVTQRLQDEGWTDLVLLTWSPEKMDSYRQRGAHVIGGNLFDADYVIRATEGVDAMLWASPWPYASTAPADDIRRLAHHAASAMEVNGISRVVHISDLGARRADRVGPMNAVRDAEEILDLTDAAVTHLRPGYLMENFLMAAGSIGTLDSFFLNVSPLVRTPMIAAADVAEVAAGMLADDTWSGIPRRVFELHGPTDLSFDEAARQIGKALGRNIRFTRVSRETAIETMVEAGMSTEYATLMAELYTAIDTGWYAPAQMRSEASQTRTTFESFIRDELMPAIEAAEPIGHI